MVNGPAPALIMRPPACPSHSSALSEALSGERLFGRRWHRRLHELLELLEADGTRSVRVPASEVRGKLRAPVGPEHLPYTVITVRKKRAPRAPGPVHAGLHAAPTRRSRLSQRSTAEVAIVRPVD